MTRTAGAAAAAGVEDESERTRPPFCFAAAFWSRWRSRRACCLSRANNANAPGVVEKNQMGKKNAKNRRRKFQHLWEQLDVLMGGALLPLLPSTEDKEDHPEEPSISCVFCRKGVLC